MEKKQKLNHLEQIIPDRFDKDPTTHYIVFFPHIVTAFKLSHPFTKLYYTCTHTHTFIKDMPTLITKVTLTIKLPR